MYERPGKGVYPTATKVTGHLAPATEGGVVGAAIKQKVIGWKEGFAAHQNPTIAIGEQFHLRTKGIHEFSTAAGSPGEDLAGAAFGTPVYIRPATNALYAEPDAASTDLPFGRVVETPAMNRGVPTDRIRIDLDQKDTIPAAT